MFDLICVDTEGSNILHFHALRKTKISAAMKTLSNEMQNHSKTKLNSLKLGRNTSCKAQQSSYLIT